MVNRIWKKVLSVGLVSIMLVSLGACGTKETVVIKEMEKEEVHSVSFDFIGGKDVMPISAFYGPYATTYSLDGVAFPYYITDEIFEKLSDCGLNMFHHSPTNYSTNPKQIYEMLELGEKHDLGLFVVDSEVNTPNKEDVTLEFLDERLRNYANYPAFCGMYVVDEPATPYFEPTLYGSRPVDGYVNIFNLLNEMDIVGSGNLIPYWEERDDIEVYKRYVEEYCSTCNPAYLSFDYYVWYSGRNRAGWFDNIDIIRQYAEKYEIPFWAYVQTGGDYNDGEAHFDTKEYYPTEGQMNWNVNACLAYGAKGIEYFMAIQPYHFAYAESTPYDFQRNGLLGAWGNKTQWWYYAQKINEQIAAVDTVLMNSVNKGVIVTGEEAMKDTEGAEFIMDGTSWRELESVEGNTMIGCFNYNGKSALYVVNYEADYAQKVTLNLQDSYNMSITQNAQVSRVNAQELVLDLKAGEGALVVFD